MNQDQKEYWNGEVGERWTLLQSEIDVRLRPFGDAVLDATQLQPGMRVLDVGCGCGDLTLAAAARVESNGSVVGIDISEPMLTRAHQRAAGRVNVQFVAADATNFTSQEPFDALVSRFGVMFFDDPTATFAVLRKQMNPGGTLAFVCWQAVEKNLWGTVPVQAALTVLPKPEPPVPNAPGPFAFADQAVVHGVLTTAGWHAVQFQPVLLPMFLGASVAAAMDYITRVGPTARLLADADDALRPLAQQAVRTALECLGPHVELAAAAWLVTARA